MHVFATDQDRLRVLRILVTRAELPNLWTPEGPTALASELLAMNGGTMSSAQRALFLFAWVVWKNPLDPTKLKASDLLGTLDGDQLHLVGTLLIALSEGPEALKTWLAQHEHE